MYSGRFLITALIISLTFLCNSYQTGASGDGRYLIFDARISPDGRSVAFSWSGDIWITDINSGSCSRITDHIAHDHHPAWFPDSRKIAFSSNRDGNNDVYSVRVTGGEPERHTWHGMDDIAQDVSPDGKNILFRSNRDLFAIDLYEVDIDGGLEHALTDDSFRNFNAVYSSDGEKIYVSRGLVDWTRRAYNGSADTDIYSMNADGSEMEWVENSYDGNDSFPDMVDDGFVFVSDRDGNENVYLKRDEDIDQLTHFRDRPVLFLSASDNGKICFVQDFRIHVMDADGSSDRTLDIDLSSEPKHSQEIRLDIGGNITEMELSPSGQYLGVISRGELFIIELHDPSESTPLGDRRFWEAVRISDTESREQYINWHPDDDRVVLSSDRSGNFEIYEINLRTLQWERLTDTDEDDVLPKYSPDGSLVAFFHNNSELKILDLESNRTRVIAEDLFVFQPYVAPYEWSPDGNWIAYTGTSEIYYGEIYIVSAVERNAESVNVTLHHDSDTFCGWAPDGESIYFLSRRNYEVGMEGYGWWSEGGTLHSLPLKRERPPASDILFPEEIEDEESGESETEEIFEIDFDRIDERAWQVTHTQGGGDRATLSPDGSTYIFESNALGNWGLWTVPFEGGSPSQFAASGRVRDVEWIPDGRGALYLAGGRINFWDKGSGNIIGVPTSGRLTVDLNLERRQMVIEAGRLLKQHFYDEDMHGMNWDEIVNLYARFASETSVTEEFGIMLRMMFGELDASHLYGYTPTSNEGIGMSPAELGLEFDALADGPGLLVDYVLPRGPCDYNETRIEPGERILKINGIEVSTSNNYWSLLDDSVFRTTVLTVTSQDSDETRDIEILPMPRYGSSTFHPAWSDAEYEDFVDGNREAVESGSDGKVGYVHIRWMSGSRLERFTRELFAENADKEALIIDIRWNPGGNIHEFLLDILSREQFGWSKPRSGQYTRQPGFMWQRPTVLLINERSSSDSEIFPAGFRTLNLGTIIGQPTIGAVIGTEGYTLVDGHTRMRLPMEGWYRVNRANLENDGVEPDIFIENDLNDIRDGIDSQLEYAIQYLLDEIE